MDIVVIQVVVITAAVILGVVVHITRRPEIAPKIAAGAAIMAAVGGLMIYGYAFAHLTDNVFLAIVETIYSVVGMFIGRSEISLIYDVPPFDQTPWQTLYWMLSLMGLFATASAAVAAFLSGALGRAKLLLFRRRPIVLMFGRGAEVKAFGYKLAGNWKNMVVFAGCDWEEGIERSGCVRLSDRAVEEMDKTFLKSIGLRPGNRKIFLYALDPDPIRNMDFAEKLRAAMERDKLSPSQASLTMLAYEPDWGGKLAASDGHFGYGTYHVFDIPSLTARLLTQHYPPCDYVTFDENGKAESNYHVMVIGFGETGRAALKSTISMGQFEGSTYHAAVFDSELSQTAGLFRREYASMLEHYDIEFFEADGRSEAASAYFAAHVDEIDQIIVSTGDARRNREIMQGFAYLMAANDHKPDMFSLHQGGVSKWTSVNEATEDLEIYDETILSGDYLDRSAKIVNHTYHLADGRTADEDWVLCDGFSRMSCRASADFLTAMLKAAGVTMEEVLQQGFAPEGELMENLAKTEHLRWWAFQYVEGYQPMSRETWEARAQQYLAETKENGKSRLRIGKDVIKLQHACMIPWNDLDELSARENAVTGGNVDYKQMDRDNVLNVEALVRAITEDKK